MELPTPKELKEELPNRSAPLIASWRNKAVNVLTQPDEKLAVIVGPCSIHETKSALEYAERLKQLSKSVENSLFPIMRVFIEKPRTRLGWKGIVYDPHLDGTHDIAAGLRKARYLLLQIAEIGVPCACEFLEPNIVSYFDDLIVWGIVGARTAASQPHRQMASALSFPIGFKNDCYGELETAISAIHASRVSHSFIGINEQGRAAALHSKGNPLTHLVLRGGEQEPNYDPISVQKACEQLKREGLEPRLVIDCSHGNSGKDFRRQREAFESVTQQALSNPAIRGIMLESHLYPGNQPLGRRLNYGVSITDPCLGWEETEELLRSTSMSLVQK